MYGRSCIDLGREINRKTRGLVSSSLASKGIDVNLGKMECLLEVRRIMSVYAVA